MWKFVENCCYQRIAPFGVRKISPVWESSETDPAKAWDFDDNNSWIKIFLDPFQSEERNEKWSHHRIFTSHLTWSCVFRRRQTYADVFRRVQTYSDVCRLTLTHWDVCRRTAAFNDSLHLGGQKISAVWESSETDPFKVYAFGENNSKFQKSFWSFLLRETQRKMRTSSKDHLTWRWRNGRQPPPPRVNVENLSADRCINSIIITGSNIDPRGGGDRRAPKMVTFLHFWC